MEKNARKLDGGKCMISLRKIKGLYLFANVFVLMGLDLSILLYQPTSGYELSPYSDAKIIFLWIILIYLLSMSGIAFGQSRHFKFLFILLMIAYLYFISIPIWKGYFFLSRADGLYQLGHIVDILRENRFTYLNYYPATHIIVSTITYASNIPVLMISKCFNLVFYVIYVLSSYVLVKTIFSEQVRRYTVLSILFIPSIFTEPLSLAPHTFAINLFPLLLYLLLKLNLSPTLSRPTIILFLLFVLFLPILHPLFSLFWTYFLGIVLSLNILKISTSKKIRNPAIISLLTFFVIFSVISFIIWLSNTILWRKSIEMFLSWLNNPENYIPATEATKLRRFSPSKIIIFVLKWMGGYITMGIIVLLLLMKRLIKKEYNLLAYYPFSQLLIIFIISFVWTMLLTFVLPTGADMFRGIRYAILSLELVFGYIFYENIHSQSKQKANTYKWIFTGIISVIIILHISNSLPSPFIEAPNGELTPMEVIGTKWVLEKGERNGIFGISTTTINGIFASILGASAELPKVTYVGDHFENLFNKKTPSRSYIWVSQVDKSMYLELWNETQRFTLIDFVKIYESKEINLVYCNEELSIHNMEGLQ